MSTIDELKKVRLEKLESLKKAGVTPYPATTERNHSIAKAVEGFSKLSKSKKSIVLAGRIMALRSHGGATFLDLYDGSESPLIKDKESQGRIQGLIREDKVGADNYKFFLDHFDIGDFVELKGKLFVTKRGEKTIEAQSYKILAKSLVPLPEKWHGLQDVEERLRKRYLDILFNPEVKDMVRKRSKFWASMREFLVKKGFLEVETPVLEVTPGGADARAFATHHNALDIDVYLRISTGELWQKQLMVAGFEKVFELGRQFRNEGMDAEHLQDYTQMEFYMAYADYEEGMDLVEELYKYVIKNTFGTLKFKIKDFDIDFGKKWERYDYQAVVKKHAGIDIFSASLSDMENQLQKLNIDYDRNGFNKTRAIDNLFKFCRKKLTGPGFLVGTPIDVSPLAKRDEKNPKVAQRFQVLIAGSEVGNGYSELNDPLDQAERFKEQQALRESGDEEAQMFDKEFVEALEYGMPPTCGFGVSERLFSFLMDKPARETQIFPLMKPRQ